MIRLLPCLTLLLLGGCATMPDSPASVPFSYAGSHLLKVPVRLAGRDTLFILDTGIGITLVDRALAESMGCEVSGSYTGKRMSGQEVEVPLSEVPYLEVAGLRAEGVQVGLWTMEGFLPPGDTFAGVEGFLSLNALRGTPFTLDYRTQRLILDDATSLARRLEEGQVIPLEVVDDGTCVTIFFELQIPGGDPLRVELDLGGNILTLDASCMQRLGVDPAGEGVRLEARNDETGFGYRRWFTRVDGPIAPAAAPELEQAGLNVMFQDIIYDGLIGNDFLKRFTVTYDLPGGRLILGPGPE